MLKIIYNCLKFVRKKLHNVGGGKFHVRSLTICTDLEHGGCQPTTVGAKTSCSDGADGSGLTGDKRRNAQ